MRGDGAGDVEIDLDVVCGGAFEELLRGVSGLWYKKMG